MPPTDRTSLPALLAIAVALAGCGRDASNARLQRAAMGNAEHGASLIRTTGCGSCHAIPGIRGARGRVGPPLDSFAGRDFIAGRIPNTPDNLVLWLENPPSIEPATAMPILGLNESDARDVAAYLYSLN
jgi:cytochrome c2